MPDGPTFDTACPPGQQQMLPEASPALVSSEFLSRAAAFAALPPAVMADTPSSKAFESNTFAAQTLAFDGPDADAQMNVVHLNPRNRVRAGLNTDRLDDVDRQVIDDGMRLVRSFLMISDDSIRASILTMVESVAAQTSIFRK